MQFVKALLGGGCKSQAWLSNPERESSSPDPGYIFLKSLWEGIIFKSIEADYFIFGWRESSDMIFCILKHRDPQWNFQSPPCLSGFLLQDWEENVTQKEKDIASMGNYWGGKDWERAVRLSDLVISNYQHYQLYTVYISWMFVLQTHKWMNEWIKVK